MTVALSLDSSLSIEDAVNAHMVELAQGVGFGPEVACVAQAVADEAEFIIKSRLSVVGEEKYEGQMVSEVDKGVDTRVCAAHRLRFPRQSRRSEEGHPNAELIGRSLILDSLDGSGIYLDKTISRPTLSSVLAAFTESTSIKFGFAFFPWSNEPNHAERGGDWYYASSEKAFKNGVQIRLNASHKKPELVYVNTAHRRVEWVSTLIASLVDRGVKVEYIQPCSGMALRMIDKGANAVMLHENIWGEDGLPKQGTWDIAAPEIIVKAAGGVRMDLQTGQDSELLEDPRPFVLGAQVHCDWIRRLLKPVGA